MRLYPGSSDTSIVQDDAVLALNKSVYGLFASAGLTVKDVRSHYRLVGAVWLDDPDHDFKVNSWFSNPATPLGGEDLLSSTAMESFTQFSSNCFTCHDTQPVGDDATGQPLGGAKKLNISHVISRFLNESQQGLQIVPP